MYTRTSFKITCVVLIPLVIGGCGYVFTHGPPTGHEQMDYFSCTESNAGPIIDIVWASLNGIGTIGIASDMDAYEYAELSIASGVAWAILSGTAAATGFKKTKQCRLARQELAARLRAAGNESRGAGAVAYSVGISPLVSTLAVGQQVQLIATARNSSGAIIQDQLFTWSSSNDAIASVSRAGLVTAHAVGEVVIAANANNTVGTASITVRR